MEFRFNATTQYWDRIDIKDSDKFVIITPGGNRIEVPNFLKTMEDVIKQLDLKNVEPWQYNDACLLPYFNCYRLIDGKRLSISYQCNLRNGVWKTCYDATGLTWHSHMFHFMNYDNEILQQRIKKLEADNQKLMAMYNHVCETNTNMDAFLNAARGVDSPIDSLRSS